MSAVDLRLGDCLEIMKQIPDKSIDCVFIDPPFNVGKKYSSDSSGDRRPDYYTWCEEWIAESFRILKDTGSLYLMTIPRHLAKIYPILDSRGVFINQINWRNVSAARHPRCFWSANQPILFYGKTQNYKFNQYAQRRIIPIANQRWGGYTTEAKGQLLDYWDDISFVYAGSIAHPEAILKQGTNEKAHPAQMPVALAERALLFATDEEDTFLEPFAGLAAGAIAAIRHNRKYIGIDLSAEYISIAERRIEAAQAQLALPLTA